MGSDFLAFNPDGTILALSLADGGVGLWDVASGERLVDIPGPLPVVGTGAVAFSPDGTLLVAGNKAGSVAVWEIPTFQIVTVLTVHSSEAGHVGAVAFSPDGSRFATSAATGAGIEAVVRLWDLTTVESVGEPIEPPSGHLNAIWFNPDGSLLQPPVGLGRSTSGMPKKVNLRERPSTLNWGT